MSRKRGSWWPHRSYAIRKCPEAVTINFLLMGEPGTGNSVCARIHSSQFSAHISRLCSYYSVMRTISRLESSWLQRESTGRRDSAHRAPQAIQRYRNQYQTDSDRCGPIDAYTHGFNFWMCQKALKQALAARFRPSNPNCSQSGGKGLCLLPFRCAQFDAWRGNYEWKIPGRIVLG